MATAQLAELRSAPAERPLAEMKPKEQIAYMLRKKQGEIAKMLPRHLNAERLLKVAQIAATTTPALAKCDVASLVGAIGQCAQMELSPTPCSATPTWCLEHQAQGRQRAGALGQQRAGDHRLQGPD